jgi:hypothetical protein
LGEILYAVASDENGSIVTSEGALKGIKYFCVICNSRLTLKKSGKTGKNSKRPHFAHKSLTPNCTPESALHYAYKNLLANKIREHVECKTPLVFNWLCDQCGSWHKGDLVKCSSEIKVEHKMGFCRPDIALLDKTQRVFAVIEVVVTHPPESRTIDFYKKNDIVFFQVNVSDVVNINELTHNGFCPSIVSACRNPPCEKCGHRMYSRNLTVVTRPCWGCGRDMKMAAITHSDYSKIFGKECLSPQDFTSREVSKAMEFGVVLKERYSQARKEFYLANTCSNCNAFVGDDYLYMENIHQGISGEEGSQNILISYHCQNCVPQNASND